MIASLLSAACIGIGFLVFANSTVTPLDNIGVMTMKMMSITSITSTMGVTLMSATGGGALCLITDSFSFAIVCLHGTREAEGSLASREAPCLFQLAGFQTTPTTTDHKTMVCPTTTYGPSP